MSGKKSLKKTRGIWCAQRSSSVLRQTCKKVNKHALLSGVHCLVATSTVLNVYWCKETTNGQAWMQVQKPPHMGHARTNTKQRGFGMPLSQSPKGPVHISNTQTIIEGHNFHYNTCLCIDQTSQKLYVVKKQMLTQLSLFPFNH